MVLCIFFINQPVVDIRYSALAPNIFVPKFCKSCALLCRVGDRVICDSAVPWGVHLVPKVV